jgi:hypothetical protein
MREIVVGYRACRSPFESLSTCRSTLNVIRGPPSKALDMLIAGSRWLVAGDERIVSKEKAGAIAERQRR